MTLSNKERAFRRWLEYPKTSGDQVGDDQLRELAKQIRAKAPYRHNARDWSDEDKDLMGVLGERAFSIALQVAMVVVPRPGGDGGIDFWLNGFSIDVKTIRSGYRYLLREDKAGNMADILVLAIASTERMQCSVVGWEFDEELLKLPVQPALRAGAADARRLHKGHLKSMSDLAIYVQANVPSLR